MSKENTRMMKSALYGSRIRTWVELDLRNSNKIVKIIRNLKTQPK